jgi:hypothetical protein
MRTACGTSSPYWPRASGRACGPTVLCFTIRAWLCHGRNLELPQFQRDPHHAEACTRQTGASVTERHNGLVRVLAELTRSVGASVRTDQPPPGEAVAAVTDPTTGDVIHEVQSSDQRGDLLVVLGARRFLVDLTVPRVTAPSDPAMATAGACTAAAEKKKRTRYGALCKHRGLTLVPFVLESYGGVGPAARAFLQIRERWLRADVRGVPPRCASSASASHCSAGMRSCGSVACSSCAWSRAHWLVRMLPLVAPSTPPVAVLSGLTSVPTSTPACALEEDARRSSLRRHARHRRLERGLNLPLHSVHWRNACSRLPPLARWSACHLQSCCTECYI